MNPPVLPPDLDEPVTVRGISALVRRRPSGGLLAWPPYGSVVGDELEFWLEYKGRTYRTRLAGSEEAAAKLNVRTGDGWAVVVDTVSDQGTRQYAATVLGPFPTVEAAIVGALTVPLVMESKGFRE